MILQILVWFQCFEGTYGLHFKEEAKAIRSYENMANAYKILHCHNPEDHQLYVAFIYKLYAHLRNTDLYSNKNSSSTVKKIKGPARKPDGFYTLLI
jgi:hypothetical protein